jgi:hypothetical protein
LDSRDQSFSFTNSDAESAMSIEIHPPFKSKIAPSLSEAPLLETHIKSVAIRITPDNRFEDRLVTCFSDHLFIKMPRLFLGAN